jgi:hypothetical protein
MTDFKIVNTSPDSNNPDYKPVIGNSYDPTTGPEALISLSIGGPIYGGSFTFWGGGWSKSYCPTSLGGFSFDFVIGSGNAEVSYGASKFLSVGVLMEMGDKSTAGPTGVALHLGWGKSTRVTFTYSEPWK